MSGNPVDSQRHQPTTTALNVHDGYNATRQQSHSFLNLYIYYAHYCPFPHSHLYHYHLLTLLLIRTTMPEWSQLAQRAKPGPRAQLFAQRAARIGSLVRLVIFLKALLGLYRHVYAYGIIGTSKQIYGAFKNVRGVLATL